MKSQKPVRVLLAEDHAVVRQGLCALVKSDPHLLLIGEARTGRDAVALAQTAHPDVIVMDISMPELNGLDATRQILAGKSTSRVLILTAHSEEEYIRQARLAGASGYLRKENSAERLLDAIGRVARGEDYFDTTSGPRGSKSPFKSGTRHGLPKGPPPRPSAPEDGGLNFSPQGSAS
jgi:DNA-binding NarL/FixJ family response regulator